MDITTKSKITDLLKNYLGKIKDFIKNAVKDWMNHKYENWVKQPIEKKTLELENFLGQQIEKANSYNPTNYYQQQQTFCRGLFWVALGLLLILWLISG
ncbi:MAG: hypothetical protein mread185_000404 [Mycoplasmataceae bacterium]|nr:MAG: hypothetical protein mread185_000404 [Mycoplasmataceae bacterium]